MGHIIENHKKDLKIHTNPKKRTVVLQHKSIRQILIFPKDIDNLFQICYNEPIMTLKIAKFNKEFLLKYGYK